MKRALASIVMASALACLVPSEARADPNSTPSEVRLGWTVVGISLVAGGGLAGASMAVECPRDDDYQCARWTSLGIWSGIAIASAGAAAGFIILTAASRRPAVQVSLGVDRATLRCTF